MALAFLLAATAGWAADPKQPLTPLDQKEFFRPDLYISSAHAPLGDVLARLPQRAAWEAFLSGERAGWANPTDIAVWVDPRSGAASNILGAYPLIPGDGFGNRIAAESARGPVDEAYVERALRQFVRQHAALLGIDPGQLGAARVTQVNPDLWQVYIPQAYRGLPVRHGHLVASISHGNLVTIGVDTWGDVRDLDPTPLIPAEAALQAGYGYAEGPGPEDVLLEPARLEVIPFAPAQLQDGSSYVGPLGQGYGHRLVWSFVFQRPPEDARWEVLVDARDGQVLALQDVNHYVQRQVTGGVYPVTSTEVCPTPLKC
ncbi:MAG TPA: PepSY domain-containing protein, partial [Vicinamibacteria bacterium]|nr:PepSY domain-containing protein [Vicinamibacteria bacterium]